MTKLKPVKHFTHTDLDGVGCAVISRAIYGDNVHVSYCEYHDINEKVERFFDSGKAEDYSMILITDISINERVAAKVDEYFKTEPGLEIALLDHHDTADWMNDFAWAYVSSSEYSEEEGRTIKTSGTSLLADFFLDIGEFEVPVGVSAFAEVVRRYDTWEWYNVYDEDEPKKLNDLMSIRGKEQFIQSILSGINVTPPVLFNNESTLLLNQRAKEITNYIDKKDKELRKIVIGTDEEGNDRLAGFLFAEDHLSILGNEICLRNTDIEFVMMLHMGRGSISFRTIRDDLDLGALSKACYGGGGHPKAAGGSIPDAAKEAFIAQFMSHLK